MRHESILRSGPAPRALVGRILATMPRAIVPPVRADASDPKAILASLATGFEEFKATHNARVGDIEAALDGQAIQLAASKASGGVMSAAPVDREYTDTFTGFVRAGIGEADLKASNAIGPRGLIMAAMSESSLADGGYVAPVEWDRRINQALIPLSPMRMISQLRTTSVQAYSTVWSDQGWGSGWVGETAARPNTANAQLSPLVFPTGEIYANPAVSQRLLDDALIDVGQWIPEQLAIQFARQEGVAFVTGDGVNKPAGFLTYAAGGTNAAVHPGGSLDVVNSGAASSIPNLDILKDFMYGLASPYRPNATWLMASPTGAVLAKFKTTTGEYLWQPSTIVGQPDTFMGRPVYFDEGMPSVAAGNLAIAFGDFRAGYVINDRMGVRVLRDPYTNKPFVSFYSTKRVGGGVLDPRAIRVMKISA